MHDQPFTAPDSRRNGSKRANAQESGVEADSKLKTLIDEAATILAEPNQQFEALLNEYRDEFRPAGPHQGMLVRELADSDWRLRQITRIQTGLQWLQMSETHSSMCRPEINIQWDATPTPRPRASIAEATDDLRTLLMGAAWLETTSLFALLVRYQNNARRDYYRALKQLELVRTGQVGYLPSPVDTKDETKPSAPPSKAAAAGAGGSSTRETNPTPPAEAPCEARSGETNPTSPPKRAGY